MEERLSLSLDGGEIWLEVRGKSSSVEIERAIRSSYPEAEIDLKEMLKASASSSGRFRVGRLRDRGRVPAKATDRRAEPRVELDRDKMTCRLWLPSGEGWTREKLKAMLGERGVVFGVLEEALEEAASMASAGRDVEGLVVARGEIPVHGEDGWIEELFSRPTGKPRVDERGDVDFYELDLMVQVRAGTVVARRHPPREGKDGRNVLGEEVKHRPGRAAAFNYGEGLRVEGNELVATRDGCLVWTGDTLSVRDLLVVNGDVDFATGNIDFNGYVLVKGDVRDGFKVEAEKSVEIEGSVERATVISRNGNISVKKGIQGKGRARIVAQGKVMAKFIQEAYVEAEEVIVNEYIFRSEIRTEKGVVVEGKRGVINASSVRAKTHVYVRNLESQRLGDTVIEVKGVNKANLYARHRELLAKREELYDELISLSAQVRTLTEKGLFDEARKIIGVYVKKKEEADEVCEELSRLRDLFSRLIGDATFALKGVARSEVLVRIKDQPLLVKPMEGGMTVYYDPDEKRLRYA